MGGGLEGVKDPHKGSKIGWWSLLLLCGVLCTYSCGL